MTKKIDMRIVVVLILLVGVAYFGGLFSVVAQDKEIGRTTTQTGQLYEIVCPATYNNFQVDACKVEPIGNPDRVGFTLFSYTDNYQGYVLDYNECLKLITGTFYSKDKSCKPTQFDSKTQTDFPQDWSAGTTAWFTSTQAGTLIYYESFIQCSDGSYNYRSSCPIENPVEIPVESQPQPVITPTVQIDQLSFPLESIIVVVLFGIIGISAWFILRKM